MSHCVIKPDPVYGEINTIVGKISNIHRKRKHNLKIPGCKTSQSSDIVNVRNEVICIFVITAVVQVLNPEDGSIVSVKLVCTSVDLFVTFDAVNP